MSSFGGVSIALVRLAADTGQAGGLTEAGGFWQSWRGGRQADNSISRPDRPGDSARG